MIHRALRFTVVLSQEGYVLLGVDVTTMQRWNCSHHHCKEMSASQNTQPGEELPFGLLAGMTREMSSVFVYKMGRRNI